MSVSEQESEATVRDFVAKYSLTYPFALDVTGGIGKQYNLYSTPLTYFIDSDGVIIDILSGAVNQPWIDRQMEKIEG